MLIAVGLLDEEDVSTLEAARALAGPSGSRVLAVVVSPLQASFFSLRPEASEEAVAVEGEEGLAGFAAAFSPHVLVVHARHERLVARMTQTAGAIMVVR